VEAAVRKALDKTPADRFPSAAKFAEALTNPAFTGGRPAGMATASLRPPARRPAVLAFGAVALVAAVLAAWGWLRPADGDGPPVIRYRLFDLALDQAQDYGTNIALSPDGELMVSAGYGEGREGFGLWVQRRDQLAPTPLPGGDGAHQPFFAPDGKRVAFITLSRALRIASLGGEPTVTLVDSGIVRGSGTWGTDGYIYLTGGTIGLGGGSQTGLVRIPASGGTLEVVSTLDTARVEVGHSFPEALPGGRGVLFTIERNRLYVAEDEEIGVVDLATGTHRVLVRGVQARWSPTGHVLVVQPDGRLVAVPFDEHRLEVTGAAIPLLEGVRVDGLGSADLAMSASGRLAYVAGGTEATASLQVAWVSRDGRAVPIDSAWTGLFLNPSISPDGSQLAVQVGVAPTSEVWVKRLERGPFSRLTFDGRFSGNPSWSADGRSVLYLSDRGGGRTRPFT
jgi:serine/threonine-protein kinase